MCSRVSFEDRRTYLTKPRFRIQIEDEEWRGEGGELAFIDKRERAFRRKIAKPYQPHLVGARHSPLQIPLTADTSLKPAPPTNKLHPKIPIITTRKMNTLRPYLTRLTTSLRSPTTSPLLPSLTKSLTPTAILIQSRSVHGHVGGGYKEITIVKDPFRISLELRKEANRYLDMSYKEKRAYVPPTRGLCSFPGFRMSSAEKLIFWRIPQPHRIHNRPNIIPNGNRPRMRNRS